jgi:hypothetical protein
MAGSGDLLKPAHVPFDVRAFARQRAQVLAGTPAEDAGKRDAIT